MKTLTTKQAIIVAAVGLVGIYGVKKLVKFIRNRASKEQPENGINLCAHAVPETRDAGASEDMCEARN